jgi:hypothetical protein
MLFSAFAYQMQDFVDFSSSFVCDCVLIIPVVCDSGPYFPLGVSPFEHFPSNLPSYFLRFSRSHSYF